MTVTAARWVMARIRRHFGLKVDHPVLAFDDRLRGRVEADPALAREDFIIHRRDGLFAYNLAVVVDDHFQGITEVVRGADLIEPTGAPDNVVSTVWLDCAQTFTSAAGD